MRRDLAQQRGQIDASPSQFGGVPELQLSKTIDGIVESVEIGHDLGWLGRLSQRRGLGQHRHALAQCAGSAPGFLCKQPGQFLARKAFVRHVPHDDATTLRFRLRCNLRGPSAHDGRPSRRAVCGFLCENPAIQRLGRRGWARMPSDAPRRVRRSYRARRPHPGRL